MNTPDQRILSIEYGTFSLRLQGFDDPFSALSSVTEYFRQLSEIDPNFGMKETQEFEEIAEQIEDPQLDDDLDLVYADNIFTVSPKPVMPKIVSSNPTKPAPEMLTLPDIEEPEETVSSSPEITEEPKEASVFVLGQPIEDQIVSNTAVPANDLPLEAPLTQPVQEETTLEEETPAQPEPTLQELAEAGQAFSFTKPKATDEAASRKFQIIRNDYDEAYAEPAADSSIEQPIEVEQPLATETPVIEESITEQIKEPAPIAANPFKRFTPAAPKPAPKAQVEEEPETSLDEGNDTQDVTDVRLMYRKLKADSA